MDVWDDEEPGQLGQVRREHTNAGYLAGITAAKEAALQPGFDEGYPAGAELGLEAGFLLGVLQGRGLDDLEKAAAADLAPASLLSSTYFDTNAKPLYGDAHPLIAKWARIVEGLDAPRTEAVPLKRRAPPDAGDEAGDEAASGASATA